MKITVAKGSGFCFGVRRAFGILEKEIHSQPCGGKIVTLGKFVHNPQIVSDLEKRGVPCVSEDQLISLATSANEKQPLTAVLRTHGITRDLKDALNKIAAENPFFKVTDCTCPCVSKIHHIVTKESSIDPENTLIIIIGDENHPEVSAIKSYCRCRCLAFPDLKHLSSLQTDKKRIVCVAQTTQKLTECKLCQNYLLNNFTDVKIYDTICKVTEERQTEVEKLAGESDVMIIIGGRESSNTNKLFEISSRIQPNTFFVEQISEIPLDGIHPDAKLGISAGASTPDSLIEEAIKAMENIENKEDFAKLLDETEMNYLKTGSVVKGTIVSVDDREVVIDLKSNLTGFISTDEFDDDDDSLKVGDEISAVVVKKDDENGTVRLSKKKADNIASKSKVEEACKNGDVLEGKVTDIIKKDDTAKGLIISALHTRFFVPASQTGLSKKDDISTMLGKVCKFKVTETGASGKHPVASIAIVENEKKQAEIDEFWASLTEGKVFEGTVKSMTDYGVFVNIGPLDGMVHKSELSWKRFRVPSDIVSVGDKLTVYVKDLNPEKRRISLGCKTAENNPWNIFVSNYSVGDVVNVKIANIMSYGAFAEIIPGVDGLIHISQIANKRLGNPAEVLHTGDQVDAKIIDIDTEKKKVSLSVRALLEPDVNNEEAVDETQVAETETDEPVENA